VSDTSEALTRALPDTPAGRQLAWWLGRLNTAGEAAAADDWDRYAPSLRERLGPLPTLEAMRDGWRANLGRMGRVVEIAVRSAGECEIGVEARTDKDRRFQLKVAVEPDPPHRMTSFALERLHEFKLDVREATAADALTLADIERRCPIVMGETSVWFDRGADYLAATRLMEDHTIGLASVDGVPAAVSCGAERVVWVGGAPRKMLTVSHLRVLPEHQRKGLWGAANRALDKYWDHVDGSSAYISVDNAAMQHGFANTPNKWGQIVERVLLDCAALAGPRAGRPASPADCGAVVSQLNAFHAGEELFVPYDAASFAARVTRAPDLYAWDKVWLADGAVVGAWAHGTALRSVTETRGVRTVSNLGVVLDYAFSPDAEGAFEALLRAWCGHLAERGFDTLAIFTSPASPGAALLGRLGRAVEGFFMWTPGIAVPEGAESRGLYTDAVYF
jgi:hypothetical protein